MANILQHVSYNGTSKPSLSGFCSLQTQKSGFPGFQRVSPQRLLVIQRQAARQQGSIARKSLAGGDSQTSHGVSATTSPLLQKALSPIETFPWDKFAVKLMQQLTDAFWFVGKWLLVPYLVVSATREVVSTVIRGKELWVPLGLLTGALIAGILKETARVLGADFEENVLPWHLVGLGILFIIVKVLVPLRPVWFQAFLFHLANGGLWQTIRFAEEWKTQKELVQGHHQMTWNKASRERHHESTI